jgi:transposase
MDDGFGRDDINQFYRRLSARIGKAKAVTAMARKIAAFFYNAVRHGMDYADPGASYYQERYRQRVLTNLPAPPDQVGGRRAGTCSVAFSSL